MISGQNVYSELADFPHSYDALNYKLSLDLYNCFISPYPKNYKGDVTITLRADSTISTIPLMAVNSSLQIDSVRGAGISFTHISNILNITLNRTYVLGETLDVKIYFQHKNVSDNAIYISNGFVFTDCEPEGARKWFPNWDKPSDKATFDLTARVPASVKLGSNGRLADSVKIADTIYYRWISRDPVATYLMVISAKVNYNLDIVYWRKISNPNDSIPIRFYWNAGENQTNLNAMKSAIIPMTTHFSNLFGEHPFEKNGFATLNNQFTWGGMENQTLTSLCPNCWSENLISHEFAHQWFGDMITCATWADITLNEGFATFCEAIWYEYKSGYNAYKSDIQSDASGYFSGNPGWPIVNPTWAVTTPPTSQLFNTAITYYKGACVLAMLRYVMGDAAFFTALKAYATDPSVKYKSAVVADLKNIFSASYGQDLSWFFDQWYFQPNHPVYANKYYFAQNAPNNWTVGFVASQTQTNTVFFKMPLEIKISFATGNDTTIRFFNSVNNEHFAWQFNRQPTSIVFDPSGGIFLKTASLTQIPPIPVEMVSFNATAEGANVKLNWNTITELNNYGFEVERRLGSRKNELTDSQWSVIGFVKGKGTTTDIQEYSFNDNVIEAGTYSYRLKQIDNNGTVNYSSEIIIEAGISTSGFVLHNNYPNPFNPTTKVKIELPEACDFTLAVYDILGNQVAKIASGYLEAGIYNFDFDGSELASGTYLYRLTTPKGSLTNKMVIMK